MKTAIVYAAVPGRRTANIFAFTLLELLIVIGLLGALATLVLPSLAATKSKAFDPIVQKEMQDIRLAFQRFYNDVLPNDGELDFFRQYGLTPLLQAKLDGAHKFNFSAWDSDKQRGWRGPYLEAEGTRLIAGQEVPVIRDPYSQDNGDEHYYRILCPGTDIDWDVRNLALVFIGTKNTNNTLGKPVQQLDSTARISTLSSGDWHERYFDNSKDDTEIIKRLILACD